MRIDYINPFVDSAVHIISETVTKNIRKGELELSTKFTPMSGVAIIVGLAGEVTGRVIIDMSQETALDIASIMNNEKMTTFDEMVAATLTELANMIVGNAITTLHELGFKFDLTPPAMLTGQNLMISDNKMESLIVPIELPQGNLAINVALKEV